MTPLPDGFGSEYLIPRHRVGEDEGGVPPRKTATVQTNSNLTSSMKQRRTMVTTGPKVPVRVFLVDSDAQVVFPGEDISAGEYRIVVEVPEWESGQLELIELIRSDNSQVVATSAARLDEVIQFEAGDVVYLRVRYADYGEPGRFWASPWFVD